MDREALTATIEAILLTAKGPVKVSALLETIGQSDVEAKEIENVLESVAGAWDRPASGMRLEKVAGGW